MDKLSKNKFHKYVSNRTNITNCINYIIEHMNDPKIKYIAETSGELNGLNLQVYKKFLKEEFKCLKFLKDVM